MSKQREIRQVQLSYERLRHILAEAQIPVRESLYTHERQDRKPEPTATIHHLHAAR